MDSNFLTLPPGGGAWEHVDSQAVVAAAELQFIGLEQGVLYKVRFYLEPSSNALNVHFNSDLNDRYTRVCHTHGDDAGAMHTEVHNAADNKIKLTGALADVMMGELTFSSDSPETDDVFCHFQGFAYYDGTHYTGIHAAGEYRGVAALTSVELRPSAGTVTGWAILTRLVEDLP